MPTVPFRVAAVTLTKLAVCVVTEGGALPAAVKLTAAVWLMTSESEVSVAVKPVFSTVVSVTVKVTCPLASEVPEAAEIVAPVPEVCARVTVLPDTATLALFVKATVMVAGVLPSAATVVGLTVTVDTDALTTGGVTPSPTGRYPNFVVGAHVSAAKATHGKVGQAGIIGCASCAQSGHRQMRSRIQPIPGGRGGGTVAGIGRIHP